MSEFRIGGVLQASYKYDAMGRQAIRSLSAPTAVTIHSVFDSEGRRIAEYNEATGALIREYVWNGWEPVAVIEGGVIAFVRTDHIGRPIFATNASGTKVWTATYTPFGGVHTSTGALPTARFPGQWFQSRIWPPPELDARLRPNHGEIPPGRPAGVDRWRDGLRLCTPVAHDAHRPDG